MILLIDNYDSFTYNLAQGMGSLGAPVMVRRSDELSVKDIERLAPSHIVISPGPGHPRDATLSIAVIRRLGPVVPILGVCLGHQAIVVALGGCVRRLEVPRHGKASSIAHDGRGLFKGIDSPMSVARYHSLTAAEGGLPDALSVAARAQDDGHVMALRHRRWPLHGVQFHPESILTPDGMRLLATFLGVPSPPIDRVGTRC